MTITKEHIVDLLNQNAENKNLDYKEYFNWTTASKEMRIELIKDILAMANTDGGGKILFGVTDSHFEFVGLSQDDYISFDTTKLNDLLHEYTDPRFSCEIYKPDLIDGKLTIVIDIPEFREVPIICKKEFHSNVTKKQVLRKGQIYIRTNKGSSEGISSSEDMRELLNRAVKSNGDELILKLDGLLSSRRRTDVREDMIKDYLQNMILEMVENLSLNNVINEVPKIEKNEVFKVQIFRALENEEFELYYQSRINLETNKVIGVEVLIRWNHPEHGVLSPDEFIPHAQELGLIVPIGEWVLKSTIEKLQSIDCEISINISEYEIKTESLILLLNDSIRRYDINPKKLVIEISEDSIYIHRDVIDKFKKIGVKVAIDNFGTGYSSLSYLKNIDFDYIKIDGTLIKNLQYDLNDQTIVTAIVALSKQLNLKVIGEHVETKFQFEFLKKIGCSEVQGYYISKPIPISTLDNTFLRK
jgi:EAL domain-containing protein (putative c-di-GMP-specific phosphodiesterase class I)